MSGFEFWERDGIGYVDVCYPSRGGDKDENETAKVQVSLMDVRAADDIRIHYDFKRDGWAIEQQKYFAWEDEECDPGWAEVAFVKAWALETRHPSITGGDDEPR